jgi:hypothetical protein
MKAFDFELWTACAILGPLGVVAKQEDWTWMLDHGMLGGDRGGVEVPLTYDFHSGAQLG